VEEKWQKRIAERKGNQRERVTIMMMTIIDDVDDADDADDVTSQMEKRHEYQCEKGEV